MLIQRQVSAVGTCDSMDPSSHFRRTPDQECKGPIQQRPAPKDNGDTLGFRGFYKVSRYQVAGRKFGCVTLEISGLDNKENFGSR